MCYDFCSVLTDMIFALLITFYLFIFFFFFSSRRRHTRCLSDWSSDVCSSDLRAVKARAHERRKAGGQPGDHEHANLNSPEPQAREAAGFGVPADCKDMTAHDGSRQVDRPDHRDENHRSEERRVGKEGDDRMAE